jgi:SAM-dependent methyltransferase
MPVLCNYLYVSAQEARSVTKGNIELVLCRHCAHLYNSKFIPDIIDYQPGYENSLHYSARYQAYAEQQANRLLDAYKLHGQDVIDIGCGKGEFLALFDHMGNCRGTGFDPAVDPLMNSDGSKVRLIADTFSEKYFDVPAKLYISRHVLEHSPQPLRFLNIISSAMVNKNAVLFLEIPDGAYILEQCSVWDIIYEHYSYFTHQSLQYLLEQTGFIFNGAESGFGGQYLTVDAFPATSNTLPDFPSPDKNAVDRITRLAEEFALNCQKRYKKVENLLENKLQLSRKIVLWGAGSKGIALLNQLQGQERIQYLVDINPEKQSKYVPGSGQQVMPPEFLTTLQPDAVLIVNDIYRQEIQTHLESLKVTAQIHSI